MCSNILPNFTYNNSGFSGAIDILVIKCNDIYNSSSWYVRYGKYKVFNTKEKIVSIYINNILSKYKMKLGKSGEAHFMDRDIRDRDGDINEKDYEIDEEMKNDQNDVYHHCIPSSEILESLNLNYGQNNISFQVYSKLQGISTINANIYLWNYNEKVIISDIDGTITKSDVRGQVAGVLGIDWNHQGVAYFYTKLYENNYKFIYLSSRAIASETRGYLNKITQRIGDQDFKLPPGPVILAPDHTFDAFKREVIDRRPHEFKIKVLTDIKNLFYLCNPFIGGFGNRITDTISYDAIGIPKSKIFIIDKESKLICNEVSFNSYHDIPIHDHFPPVINEELISNVDKLAIDELIVDVDKKVKEILVETAINNNRLIEDLVEVSDNKVVEYLV